MLGEIPSLFMYMGVGHLYIFGFPIVRSLACVSTEHPRVALTVTLTGLLKIYPETNYSTDFTFSSTRSDYQLVHLVSMLYCMLLKTSVKLVQVG